MRKHFYWIVLTLILGVSSVFAQLGLQRPGRGLFARDLFNYRILNFADLEDRTRSLAQVHIQLVNDVLTFVKADDGSYSAKYDLEMIFYNEKNEVAGYAMQRDTVTVKQFSETNQRSNPVRKKMAFSLPPGKYQYVLKLQSSDGQVLIEDRNSVKLTDFSPAVLQMSNLILADEVNCEDGSFLVNLRNAFDQQKSDFGFLFELYAPQDADSVRLQVDVRDLFGNTLYTQSQTKAAQTILGACYALKEVIKKPGQYVIRVQAATGSRAVKSEENFAVFWGDVSSQLSSLDLAIEQLALIAKGSTIREMRAAAPEEREKLYEAFWQKRDPNPATAENELKEEFFLRIDLANRQFAEAAVNREGWRTDRGRILIQYGQPDDIERQSAEMYSPAVEIWSYSKQHRRFIFVDRSGNGEYRLVKNE